MRILTFKGRPVTLGRLYEIEARAAKVVNRASTHLGDEEGGMYVSAPTARACKGVYLHHFGFTWAERVSGVEVSTFEV